MFTHLSHFHTPQTSRGSQFFYIATMLGSRSVRTCLYRGTRFFDLLSPVPSFYTGGNAVRHYGHHRLRPMGAILSQYKFQVPNTSANPFICTQKSPFSSRGPTDPYELLNVSRTATAKEIKLAYFREAKKYHPDLNPNDPSAKEKFQRISAAYELLSDESRRRAYDTTGRTNETTYGSSGGSYGSNTGQQHAEDVFNSVKEDLDVIKDAFQMYTEEIKDEFNYAVDCAKNEDWQGLWDVAKDYKFLIMGVVVPTVVFLRYPPAVFVVMRVIWAAANVALVGLLRTGNIQSAARMVWQGIVTLSREQKRRARTPRKRSK